MNMEMMHTVAANFHFGMACQIKYYHESTRKLCECSSDSCTLRWDSISNVFFFTGLQIGGLLEVLRSHQKESYSLFKGSDVHLTADVFENMLKFKYDMIIPGSNNMAIAQAIEQGCFLLLQAAEWKYTSIFIVNLIVSFHQKGHFLRPDFLVNLYCE